MSLRNTTILDDFDPSEVRCMGDHVLVEVYERIRTKGGIILGKSKATECMIGKVVGVGSGLLNSYDGSKYPIGIEAGEYILTMEYIGERVENSLGKYRFLHAHGVWAKVKVKDMDSFDIMDIEPQFAFMLVEPKDDEQTKGGIFLAAGHDSKEAMRQAKIIKVGPGQWDAKSGQRIPVPIEAGLDILMARYAGADVTVDGKQYRLVDYSDVKAILER